MCTAIYIVFGTTYVLLSKKYDKAEQLISEQKYVDAIDILDALKDYKNSQNLLKISTPSIADIIMTKRVMLDSISI